MMAWPIDGRFMTPDQFRAHVASLTFDTWRPIGIVWHNTASPNLALWKKYSRQHWMDGLQSYYKGLGWNGGPHLFCDPGPDGIGLFNRLNARGTHSPSFNAQYIGIEHVGDFNVEDDDAGPGLSVKMNGIMATAIICARLGIPVDATHIKLHKEDPRTDHDCPGKDMAQDKLDSIQKVLEYMGTGGDHDPDWGHVGTNPTPTPVVKHGHTTIEDLNLRDTSSMSGAVLVTLSLGRPLDILGEAQNGSTLWYHVKTPDKPLEGWVSARYVALD